MGVVNDRGSPHCGTRLLVAVAALVIIFYGINQAQAIVALCLLSAFLALIGRSLLLMLEE